MEATRGVEKHPYGGLAEIRREERPSSSAKKSGKTPRGEKRAFSFPETCSNGGSGGATSTVLPAFLRAHETARCRCDRSEHQTSCSLALVVCA